MKRFLFLIAVLVLIGTNNFFPQKLAGEEPDPYLLWQTTDPLGYSGFVIHPNGNIIANRNCEFFEVNGNTGEQIRIFPVHYGFSEILSVTQSPDGKYFAAIYAGIGDSVIIYITDYQSCELYDKIVNIGDNVRFFPDSKRLLITTFDRGHPNASLSIYNLEDKSYKNFGAGFSTEGFNEIAISEDGKYFATGGRIQETNEMGEKIYFTRLRLWDAITLKPIKELANIEGNFEVKSIKFSPDGKYVGFHKDLIDVLIFELDNFIKIKDYLGGNFYILNNNLFAFYSSNFPTAPPDIIIKNIVDDKQYYSKRAKNGGNDIFQNHSNNTLIYLDAGQLWALDLKKLQTTVREPIRQNSITTQYKKSTLIISGLNSISTQIIITISDISGRVIRKLDSLISNSELRIPLKLPNGTYLIHIQDGNQDYSSKFLVTE